MTLIKYEDWNASSQSLGLIAVANEIIDEYEKDGYVLTLRQLYYQFVARALVKNSERSYKNLGATITKARHAGLVSWTAIEDRNRGHETYLIEEDEAEPIARLPNGIQFDQWDRQDYYVEVWVEKEALGNVVARACGRLMVPHMACKGYLSASEAWRAGQRFEEQLDYGKNCIVLHLGDHDPSGLDMTRDNQDRLNLFTRDSGEVHVNRIALNRDQIDRYQPPPNPAKFSDSRAPNYVAQHGSQSWELDALEPKMLDELITTEVQKFIDWDTWENVKEQQSEKRDLLRKVGDRWDDIKNLINES